MVDVDAGDGAVGGSTSRPELAVVEFVGALAYGQLRAWTAAVAAVPLAPDVRTSEELARRTAAGHELWLAWRGHLDTLTDLPGPVLERQREAFDAFFGELASGTWEEACTDLAFAWPIAHDFAALLVPHVDGATRALVERLSTGDDRVAEFALDQLRDMITTDEDVERVRARSAEVVGRALTNYQRAVADSDALDVLLQATDPGDVRRLAIDVMANHHRRLAALGIDDPQ